MAKELDFLKKRKGEDIFPVVIHYSFDAETEVVLFNSEAKARTYIEQDFTEEVRIQTEENGHIEGDDLIAKRSEDGLYAQIIISYGKADMPDDIIEWSIGTVKEA